jgi:hypothetical protein
MKTQNDVQYKTNDMLTVMKDGVMLQQLLK